MSKARNPISFPGMLRIASGVDLLESKPRREDGILSKRDRHVAGGRNGKKIIVGTDIGKRCL